MFGTYAVVLLLMCGSSFVGGDCIWFGLCPDAFSRATYCAYNGPPKRLTNSTALHILSVLCPEYYDASGPLLCCDADQINAYNDASKLGEMMLRRCPACWANFRRLLCGMTCDPKHSEFVVASSFGDPVKNATPVTGVIYGLTTYVADNFYNSCQDVSWLNGRAIDALCNDMDCNRDKLLAALGSSDRSPFKIDYVVSDVSFQPPGTNVTLVPFNATSYLCNSSLPKRAGDRGGPACSCSDCRTSCTTPPIPPPSPGPTYVFGIYAWWFAGFIVFGSFTVIFATYQIAHLVYSQHHRTRDDVGLDKEEAEVRRNQLKMSQINKDSLISNEPVGCLSQLSARLENGMSKAFSSLGRLIARWPIVVLGLTVAVVIILSAGLARFTVTTNPVDLWTGPQSQSRLEKNYFDQHFAPFYRTEQLIIRPVNQTNITHMPLAEQTGDVLYGPAFNKTFLTEVFRLEGELMNLMAPDTQTGENVTLQQICFQPMEPDITECAITSVLQYFQHNFTFFNSTVYDEYGLPLADYMDQIMHCVTSPTSMDGSALRKDSSCLAASGIPMDPSLVLGSFEGTHYNSSRSIVMTLLVNNNADPNSDVVRQATAWEAAYIKHVQSWAEKNKELLSVSFQAERSVEDEINRQSQSDISTVGISYIVMFVYVSLFLASYRSCRTTFVDLRVTLGLGGVLIVLASVACSIGLWSFVGLPATLIIIEVIPFLVLAVGVDNIFILVHDFEFDEQEVSNLLTQTAERRTTPTVGQHSAGQGLATSGSQDDLLEECVGDEPAAAIRQLVEARIARTLGRVGPSMLLTSLTESVAFFCGSLTSMPAVRVFALYAGMAIIFNFLLQIFAFVALLTLDGRRYMANKFDIFCCFGLKSNPNQTVSKSQPTPCPAVPPNTDQLSSMSLSAHAYSEAQLDRSQAESTNVTNQGPWLHRLIANGLTPVLLSGWARPFILVLAVGWACFSVAILPNGLKIGLDQRLSMPTDSYVLDYFNALSTDLRIGPPVYFVVTQHHDFTNLEGQNEVCGGVGCPQASLLGQISDATRIANYTSMAKPASSWLDDYFDWLDPLGSSYCCRLYKNRTTFCPSTVDSPDCVNCDVELPDGRPSADDFNRYLPFFLSDNPGLRCPKSGKAAYHTAVELLNLTRTNLITLKSTGSIPPITRSVGATSYMAYHTVLKEPDDYIAALRSARQIAANVTRTWRLNQTDGLGPQPNSVFAYSVFYVFYEQYLTLIDEMALQLGVCLLAVTVVTFIFLGLNIAATAMVLIGVAYIVVSLMALMVLWDVSLNALSLVNLVVALGISVEFCAHIVRAFTISVEPTRVDRAKAALTDMGSSILRGITLTKLGGIVVLAFSKSRLFEIFYFRMYIGIILFGAITGLIILPVLLSYFGPAVNVALVRQHRRRLARDREDYTAVIASSQHTTANQARSNGEQVANETDWLADSSEGPIQATGWGSNRIETSRSPFD